MYGWGCRSIQPSIGSPRAVVPLADNAIQRRRVVQSVKSIINITRIKDGGKGHQCGQGFGVKKLNFHSVGAVFSFVELDWPAPWQAVNVSSENTTAIRFISIFCSRPYSKNHQKSLCLKQALPLAVRVLFSSYKIFYILIISIRKIAFSYSFANI